MLFRNRSSKSKSPKLVQFPSIVPSPIKATETTTVGNNTVKTDTGNCCSSSYDSQKWSK